MVDKKKNPYIKCTKYETNKLICRIVEEKDALDLLECYSDPVSAKIFNSDNCINNFVYETLDEVKKCINFWIEEYQRQAYIRFSIVNKLHNKVIGTMEIFVKKEQHEQIGKIGVLRVDLASKYEDTEIIKEILEIVDDNFFELFEISAVITKAIPEAKCRVESLRNKNYNELNDKTITQYDNYYIKIKNTH